MTEPVSLGTQIGTIKGIAAQTQVRAKGNSREAEFAKIELRSLEATIDVLSFLINHADDFKAFMVARMNGEMPNG
ncbi:hypothetical protein OF122_13035 [Pelagibacterium flavum]|uniref:Uncharacterized protein n=1 Tax=Pelagibacterium flavum TaxID=2984530 RepID=A0ABY6IK53_9HYPH|nr:hypothetical protein [Pelagibacterium sp. YIM 151497]UYQ70983.1 hypothetical protein OF122_13035 [Pelagibacterium sp. YIM 151497]